MKLPRDLERKVMEAAIRPPDRPVLAEAGELVVVVTIPGLVVVSEANRRDHWAVKRRRARAQQKATLAALVALGPDVRDRLRSAAHLRVRFVRVGGKKLDTDNLVGAFKAVRDQLARYLHVDDGEDWWSFDWPAQECGEKGVRIEITATARASAKHPCTSHDHTDGPAPSMNHECHVAF